MKTINALTRIFLIPVLAGSLLATNGCAEVKVPVDKAVPPAAQAAPEHKAPEEKLSYAMGMVLGNQLRNQSVKVDLDSYVQGLKDALAGGQTRLTEAEAQTAIRDLQKELQKKRAEQEVAAAPLSSITVSFKLDPRITQGTYMGDRWVSPPTYTSTVQGGKEIAVEARVSGLDAKGREMKIHAEWLPEDPEMVTVTPGQGDKIRITVQRAGQSTLKVASQGVSKELRIKAMDKGNAMRVEISQ